MCGFTEWSFKGVGRICVEEAMQRTSWKLKWYFSTWTSAVYVQENRSTELYTDSNAIGQEALLRVAS